MPMRIIAGSDKDFPSEALQAEGAKVGYFTHERLSDETLIGQYCYETGLAQSQSI